MDQQQEINRGQQATELLNHPLMQEAISTLRSQYQAAWEASPARDKEGREELWKLLKTLGAVEGHLKQVIETGRMATIQREQDSLLQRMKAGVNSLIG